MIAAITVVVAAISLGGGSRLHAWQVALLELSSLPLMVLATRHAVAADIWSRHKTALLIAASIVTVPLLQLVPLPPAIWTALPGREDLVLALDLAGLSPGWSAMSVSPDRTAANLLALLPPLALFVALLAGPPQMGLRLVQLLLGAAVVSILLGAAQLVSGSTEFYVWPTTDAGNVVGLFANRNHFATMLVVALPFAAALAAAERQQGARYWIQALAVGFLVLVMIALAGGGSRAGMLLFGPSAGLSIAIWLASTSPRPNKMGLLALVAGGTIVLAIGAVAFAPVLDRFDGATGEGGRLDSWKTVIDAIPTYLPVGAGTGAFDAVYRSIEPLSRVDPTFLNQAHNDWLEILLESGLLGAAALAAFCVWWVRRTFDVWSAKTGKVYLGRAASAGILMVLLHSTVDYPVRTLTIAVVLALCAGVLERAAQGSRGKLSPA